MHLVTKLTKPIFWYSGVSFEPKYWIIISVRTEEIITSSLSQTPLLPCLNVCKFWCTQQHRKSYMAAHRTREVIVFCFSYPS